MAAEWTAAEGDATELQSKPDSAAVPNRTVCEGEDKMESLEKDGREVKVLGETRRNIAAVDLNCRLEFRRFALQTLELRHVVTNIHLVYQ